MKVIRNLLLIIWWLYFSLNFWNFSFANDYEYEKLDVLADVKIDWSINVKETFTANFFEHKHWIIRFIPLNYSVLWKDFHIDISDIYVEWNNFTQTINNWELEIKIWDANRTIIWEQIYPIFYSAYGLIRNFSWMWYAELYWNLVWYDFDTNINSFKAEILLPKGYTWFSSDDFLITVDWKTSNVKDFAWSVNRSKWDRISINYNKKLSAGEWITLAIKFPSDYFEFDHKKQSKLIGYVWWKFNTNLDFFPWKYLWIWIIIIIVFVMITSHGDKWSKIKESELANKLERESPIVVKYTPPEWINCAEAWMLYDCYLQEKDLTSLLYKRAVEWFISITLDENWTFNRKTWFIMTKLKDINSSFPQYEIDLFNSILPRGINSKKYVSTASEFDIVRSLKSLRNYGKGNWWISVWWFNNSKKYIWFFIAIILLFVLGKMGVNMEAVIFITVVLFSIFNADSSSPSQKQISLTDKWKQIAKDVIWYAKFIQMCDENKLRLFLKQDSTFFDKTLPYAVAFWFETDFINKITPVLAELDMRPSWFGWNVNEIDSVSRIVRDSTRAAELRRAKERERLSTYSSDSWFSSGSSFSSWWFSFWWWGGWWGSRSW